MKNQKVAIKATSRVTGKKITFKAAPSKPQAQTKPQPKPQAKFEDVLFKKYADSETNISPEGLAKLCKDINLNMNHDVTIEISLG